MDLITKRMSLNDVGLPSWVKGVLGNHNLDKGSAQLIRKGVVPSDMKFKESERSSVDYITTKSVDRDGEIVVPSGAMLDHYRKHPVVLWAHDYKQMPVGKSLWIKADENGLISKTQYSSKGRGAEVFEYRKEGFPMAKSIGFIPIDFVEERDFDSIDLKSIGLVEEDLRGASRVYTKWLMLEYSDVPVPSNPDALQLAIAKGILTMEEAKQASIENNAYVIDLTEDKELVIEIIGDSDNKDAVNEGDDSAGGVLIEEENLSSELVNKPETTDNYHHIPIRDKSLFVDGSFRTITLSDSQGIKAVIGKLKSDPDGSTVTQKYLFDVTKFSMSEAQAWVDSHKDQEAEETKAELEEAEEKMLIERYGNSDEAIEDIEKAIPAAVVEKEVCWLDKEVNFKELADLRVELPIEESERWNKGLSKAFDIAAIDLPPSSFSLELMSRFLKCKVKEIFLNDYGIPSTLLGSFLSAFKEVMSGWELKDIRNFSYGGTESPPLYEVIQLNSEKSEEFLIRGTAFYEKGKDRIAMEFYPTYSGMRLSIYSNLSIKEDSKAILKDAQEWVDKNCFLKGEAFDLGGEFISKTDETWSDIFISDKNEESLKRSTRLIDKNGNDMSNRGILLIGPPGTGKTLAGRIIKNLTDSTFIWVSSRDFAYSGSVGGVAFAFKLARKLAPTILFIEDIDNWLNDHTTDLLKTEMDGILKSKGVLTILTSNYPEKLPDALIDRPGRFHDLLNLELPNPSARSKMIRSWVPSVDEKSVGYLVDETRGMSGAHIYELISFAKTLAEEDDISLDDAIILSLKKLKEQRELIERIQSGDNVDGGEKSIEIVDDSALFDLEIKDIPDLEEKAGRTLSKRTRTVLTDAVNSMSNAISSINEFIDASDSKEEPIEVTVDDQVEEANDEKTIIIGGQITKDSLTAALKASLSEMTKEGMINPSELVKKRLDLYTGKVS